MKRKVKLYNIILPIWILYFLPPVVFLTLVLNLLIDLLVVKLSIPKDKKASSYLWRAFGFGYLADFLGAGVLLGAVYLAPDDSLIEAMMMNAFSDPLAFVLTALGVAAAGVLIYFFNKKFNFKDLSPKERHKAALALAVFTAPYTFFIPANLFYY